MGDINTRTRTGLLRGPGPAERGHHHLVCRGCGRTEDVGHLVDDTPCARPTTSAGFTIDEAEVVFRGHCPDCLPNRHP